MKEQQKDGIKFIWRFMTIILTILTIVLFIINIGNKYKKVKAETQETYYYINAVQSINVNTFNDLARYVITITSNESTQGILYTNDYNTPYRINEIRVTSNNSLRYSMRLIDQDNTYVGTISFKYSYNSNTQTQDFSEITDDLSYQYSEITAQTILSTSWQKGEYLDTYLSNNYNQQQMWNLMVQLGIITEYTETKTKLDTPVITINQNTIHWQSIENATYYNIFMNGDLIGQTEYNQWVTIQNGTYTIQACSNDTENYINSEISNEITQNNYNDMIGNGVNWFTFYSAYVDSQIHLMKAYLNYTIWDINFYQLFTFIITIMLAILIIKFIKGW